MRELIHTSSQLKKHIAASPLKKHCMYLDVAELGDLVAGSGDGDGAAGLEPVEEPLLHGVVVERAVDVHRPDGRPVHAARGQQALRLQLPLVPALRVHGVRLHSRMRIKAISRCASFIHAKDLALVLYLTVWEQVRLQIDSS
jgi:serine kinase of HPr protein (carbohydrate metabolism regulator)